MQIHSIYNLPPKVKLDFTGTVSRTQQHFREECDLNHMLEQYNRTGRLPVKTGNPFFGDFSKAIDFHTAHNFLIEAQENFMELPAKIRERFKNDPGLLLNFLSVEENREEAIKMGLIIEQPKTVTVEDLVKTAVEAVQQPPASGASGPSAT